MLADRNNWIIMKKKTNYLLHHSTTNIQSVKYTWSPHKSYLWLDIGQLCSFWTYGSEVVKGATSQQFIVLIYLSIYLAHPKSLVEFLRLGSLLTFCLVGFGVPAFRLCWLLETLVCVWGKLPLIFSPEQVCKLAISGPPWPFCGLDQRPKAIRALLSRPSGFENIIPVEPKLKKSVSPVVLSLDLCTQKTFSSFILYCCFMYWLFGWK